MYLLGKKIITVLKTPTTSWKAALTLRVTSQIPIAMATTSNPSFATFQPQDGLPPVDVKAVFIDCDGIIFNSNSLKTNGYRQTLKQMGISDEGAEKFVQLHLSDVSVSRFVKFKKFFEEINPVPDPEAKAAEAVEKFGVVCLELYRGLTPEKEVIEFAKNSSKIFVVSGGAQTELRTIFGEKNISDHFDAIYGSPITKPEHVKKVLEEQKIDPSNALFIGDGFTDFKTARAMNIHFVFLKQMSDWHKANEQMGDAINVTKCDTWEDIVSRTSF